MKEIKKEEEKALKDKSDSMAVQKMKNPLKKSFLTKYDDRIFVDNKLRITDGSKSFLIPFSILEASPGLLANVRELGTKTFKFFLEM